MLFMATFFNPDILVVISPFTLASELLTQNVPQTVLSLKTRPVGSVWNCKLRRDGMLRDVLMSVLCKSNSDQIRVLTQLRTLVEIGFEGRNIANMWKVLAYENLEG